jgi:MarR-like DNA-binding transcriptional regulator SgrR of sgrS sRNA
MLIEVDLLGQKFEWRNRDSVGRVQILCLPGRRLNSRLLPAWCQNREEQYLLAIITATIPSYHCHACCSSGSLIWEGLII